MGLNEAVGWNNSRRGKLVSYGEWKEQMTLQWQGGSQNLTDGKKTVTSRGNASRRMDGSWNFQLWL